MLKLLFLLNLISHIALASIDFLEFEAKKSDVFNVKRSKWSVDLGGTYLGYKTELAPFVGKHNSISKNSTETTYNVNLAFGREFYLGKGISFILKAGALTSSNEFEKRGKAAEDIDYILSSLKEKFELFSSEVSASVGYIFENSVLHIQPFVEFGVGSGQAKISKIYEDKGIASTVPNPDVDYAAQSYRYRGEEDFLVTRATFGVNFLSNYNLNSYVKISQNSISVKKRNIKELSSTASLVSPGTKGKTNQSISASLGLNVTF